MDDNGLRPDGAFLMNAVFYNRPGPADSGDMLYGLRDLDIEARAEDGHPSDRFQRQIDYIHEMFEFKGYEKNTKDDTEQDDGDNRFVFLALPVISMEGFFAETLAAVPDDDIRETLVFSEDEIKRVFRDVPIPIEFGEIRHLAGKAFPLGDLPFVRGIIADILTESLIEAGVKALEECRISAVKKIRDTLTENSYYINLLKDRTKPFPERIAFIKSESLEPMPSSPANVYGIPQMMSLPDSGDISCMRLVPDANGYSLVPGTENVSSFAGNTCVHSVPWVTPDLSGIGDFIEAVSGINTGITFGPSDPGMAEVFALTEDNMAFMASEIYSGEILAKKINHFRISREYILEGMEKKISEIKHPDQVKGSLKVNLSSFDPRMPLYTKPKIRHTVLENILGDTGDGKNIIKDRKFSGTNGDTFEIRTGWLPGEEAAYNIASAICGQTRDETVIVRGEAEVCENPLKEQIKKAVLKIKGRLTKKDTDNIEGCLDPSKSNDKQFIVHCTLLTYDNKIKENKDYLKYMDDPDEFIYPKRSYDAYIENQGQMHNMIREALETTRYGNGSFDKPTPVDIDIAVNNFLSNGTSFDKEVLRLHSLPRDPMSFDAPGVEIGLDFIDIYDYNDVWKDNMPIFFKHLQGFGGTMQHKPGNITWYSKTNCDNAADCYDGAYRFSKYAKSLHRPYINISSYEDDAKFHTVCDRYEFFNTLAIRKYAGFAAPFIGPAADSVASYRIKPNLPVKYPTEPFADSVKENIYAECMGDDPARKMVLKSRKYEDLADLLREYGWIGADTAPAAKTANRRGDAINAAYHSFGPEENGSFLEKDADLNSYKTMDMLSDMYFKLKDEKFEEFITDNRCFEQDGLNPLNSAKNGFSKYLRTPKDRFELLPKDTKRIPTIPGYYKDALEFENMDKKDCGRSGYDYETISSYKKEHAKNEFKPDRTVYSEHIEIQGHLSRPLGVEPYMEPYGSSRDGKLIRPLESLRFTNTVSRNREELELRNTEKEDTER